MDCSFHSVLHLGIAGLQVCHDGVIVCAPCRRDHAIIMLQAMATLSATAAVPPHFATSFYVRRLYKRTLFRSPCVLLEMY